jgi:valyl-tRNA synthetase
MALLQGAARGTDIVLTEERMISARAFANKIWNAARFLFLKMEYSGVEPCIPEPEVRHTAQPCRETLAVRLEDRWIFSRLNRCADLVNRAIEQYRYHEAAQTLWQFFWHEFCDWYVEIKKLRFEKDSGMTPDWRNILTVFDRALRLLHPAMPFITEELWQRLTAGAPDHPASIALAPYPEYRPELADHLAEREMEILQAIVTSARNLRAEMKLDPRQELEGVLYSRGTAFEVAQSQDEAIRKLAGMKLDLRREAPSRHTAAMRSTPEFDLVLRVPVAQADAQRNRIEKEILQLERLIANSQRQLGNEEFTQRAPAKVVDSIRGKLGEYEAQLAKSRATLAGLQ